MRFISSGCKSLRFSEEKRKSSRRFKNTPHRRCGQGPGQCGPNVRGRFAFPAARNHRIESIFQELSGTANHWYFLKGISGTNGRRTEVQIGGVLQYKLEVYYGVSLSSQPYKWGAYCGTNWSCTASTIQTSCTGWGFLNSAHFRHGSHEGFVACKATLFKFADPKSKHPLKQAYSLGGFKKALL